MADSDKKPEAPKEDPAIGQIVGYLKDYPFLLITVAGLVILSGILIFDIEKLKEFKWLIYAVVLVPLAIQFLIEFKKMQPRQTSPAAATPDLAPHQTQPVGSIPPSRKAWISMGISILLFGIVTATDEQELSDQDFALGFLIFALVACGFALAAIYDVNRMRASGKGMAITSIVISILLVLASIGWMTPRNGGTSQSHSPGEPVPAKALSGAAKPRQAIQP